LDEYFLGNRQEEADLNGRDAPQHVHCPGSALTL
jgi:hypothetical protein